MQIEVAEEAVEVLERALELAHAQDAGVRLHVARGLGGGADVQVEIAEAPVEGDEIVEVEGLRLFVDPGITDVVADPFLTVEPQHDRVVVRSRTAP